MELLKLIARLCAGGAEVDDTDLAREAGVPLAVLREKLEELDGAGLICLEEYGFSCTVEYAVSGLTQQGRARLSE